MLVPAQRREPSEVRRGVLEAFFAIRNGFSADRVIADPDLNEQFLQACRRIGLPGQARDWNIQLLNLRKAGSLAGLPRSEMSYLPREEIDLCSYACEIALQRINEQGRTLDQVLCEPTQAAEFDRFVQSMISMKVSPFKIRWVALYIRKRAKKNRQAGLQLNRLQPLPKDGQLLSSLNLNVIPAAAGLYWLQSPDKKLYVGETIDLRRRFQLQFQTPGFGFWETDRRTLDIRYSALNNSETALLKANQSRWIAHWKPVGNYSGFAAA